MNDKMLARIATSAALASPLPAFAHVDHVPHVHAYVWAGLAVAAVICAIAWKASRNDK